MEPNKNSRNNELKKIKKALNNLQNMGIIKYSVEDKDKFNIKYNIKFTIEVLLYLSDIPIPIYVYNRLKQKYKNDTSYMTVLSIMLVSYGMRFNDLNRDTKLLNYLDYNKVQESDDKRVRLFSRLVQEFYDLDRPKSNFLYPDFYWFKVKDGVIEKFKIQSDKQQF
ncbi:MAG: hypothetical protein N3B21_09580 [Clostridia bacterium]|nr:hypothetical protein [Clostridia bacterium]